MYSTIYKGFCKKVLGLKQTDIENYILDLVYYIILLFNLITNFNVNL